MSLSDSTEHYLQERLADASADLPLALAFVDPGQRSAFRLLVGVRAELLEFLGAPNDPDPALARLAWWQQEWQRLVDHQPRHPLTQGLASHGDFADGDFDPAIAATASMLQIDSCETTSHLDEVASGLGESLGRIEAGLYQLPTPTSAVWRDIVMADILLDLRRLAERGRAVVPLDIAARLQVSRSSIHRSRQDLDELRTGILEAHPPLADQPLGPGWIYRSLRLRRLRTVSRGREPRSFGQLLSAWRARRDLLRR